MLRSCLQQEDGLRHYPELPTLVDASDTDSSSSEGAGAGNPPLAEGGKVIGGGLALRDKEKAW